MLLRAIDYPLKEGGLFRKHYLGKYNSKKLKNYPIDSSLEMTRN